MAEVHLDGADLSGAKLCGATIVNADLSVADTQEICLEGSQQCELDETLSAHSPHWVSWSG
ncbi:pentapeptide repeat-containing protein [Crocosphaera watsonii]|uniref:pentapeptide repeat-containing protein n=1 Tax=Crocosphaera watsonii TaxID=263511 RepID=UPI001E46BF97|nr:pentapeptide repeat-containing protein [Crocosphaera watsonii]